MSDFDPVSDFLTREQEALGDLGLEINPPQSDASTENVANGVSVNVTDQVEQIDQPENGGFVLLNTENKNSDFLQEVEDLPSFTPPFGESNQPTLNGSLNGLQSEVTWSETKGDNESWREAFNERILKKDAEEEKKILLLKDEGEKELNAWYKHYKKQLETHAKEIRSIVADEPNTNEHGLSSTQSVLNDGELWNRVCNMCDFNAKPKLGQDMSRMRSTLLSMKPSAL